MSGPHLDVLQPVGLVNGRVPRGLVDGGVDHLLEFPQRVPHHMDVGDLQEAQLHVGVEALALVSAIFGLRRNMAVRGGFRGDSGCKIVPSEVGCKYSDLEELFKHTFLHNKYIIIW